MTRHDCFTVPTSRTGQHGWTLCCDAAVDIAPDGAFCCKACWSDVVPSPPVAGLDLILKRRELGQLTITEAIAAQRKLLERVAELHFAPRVEPVRPERATLSRPAEMAERRARFGADRYLAVRFPGTGAGR